jgi:hypothetical protein
VSLGGIIRVFCGCKLEAVHTRRDLAAGWATCPEYHERLWAEASPVEALPMGMSMSWIRPQTPAATPV